MTYLQLINGVLDRLRLERIADDQVDSNPFYRSIGQHVNDAKREVESSWQWGALRAVDVVPLDPNVGVEYSISDSADTSYVIKDISVSAVADPTSYSSIRQISSDRMRTYYSNSPSTMKKGQPTDVAVTGVSQLDGNISLTVFPPSPDDGAGGPVYQLLVSRVKNQNNLTDPEGRLLVPSLPVVTLATALASRERGEVGGAPTSELFAQADSHLADAIAYDSALYGNEMDWYSAGGFGWANTNVSAA